MKIQGSYCSLHALSHMLSLRLTLNTNLYLLLQVSVAIGCATRDRTVAFASTFAAFFSRAYDQIRMGAISQSNVNLVGSHCGVSIGKPSAKASLALFI